MYNQCALKRASDGCTLYASDGCKQAASTSASAGRKEDSGDLLDLVGMFGFAGLGKSTLCRCLCNYYCAEFHGKVCWLDLGSIPDFSQASHETCSSRSSRMQYLLSKLTGRIDNANSLTFYEVDL